MVRSHLVRRLSAVTLALLASMPLGTVFADGSEDSPEVPQTNLYDGWVLVPTHPLARFFSAATLTGITHDTFPVLDDAPFRLERFSGPTVSNCVGSTCAEAGDFDIVFLKENPDGTTTLLERHSRVGAEEGRVPQGATLAIVYLTTPGLDPGVRGHHYLYSEGNRGSDEIPKRA